jgi:hypothetical protein
MQNLKMENTTKKPKLVILGASHAKRLLTACKENTGLTEKFEVLSNVQSGATWETFQFKNGLLNSLTSLDILVIQFLGNNLLQRHIDITPNPKTIHLTKFVPQPDSYVRIIREQFAEKLSSLKCKIYIIDDPYRHIGCCPNHEWKGLLGYLGQRNRELHAFFSQYMVLDHRRMMEIPFRKLKCIRFYENLLEDKVHFYPVVYKAWANYLYGMLR